MNNIIHLIAEKVKGTIEERVIKVLEGDTKLDNIVDSVGEMVNNIGLDTLGAIIDELNLKGKNVFVFSTSGIGKKFYNKSLIKVLKSKGAIVRGSFACMGSFVTKDFSNFKLFDLFAFFARNHPNKKDFKDAEKFIDRVIDF